MSPLLISLVAVVHAAQPSLVAPPWKTVQVPADLADFYADHLAQALRREGFKVVSASEVSALLSLERQKQLLGCSEESTSCLTELGAAMGCDAVLLVSLAKLEDLYRGNLKIVSAVDGTVLAETQVEAAGQKALLGALDDGARRLAQGMPGKLAPAGEVRASQGTKRLWWIPAAVAGLGAVTATVGFIGTKSSYDTLTASFGPGHVVTATDEGTASTGKTMQLVAWTGVGVAVAGLAGMGALLLFGSDAPVTPSVAITPSGATFTLGASFP